MKIHMPYNTPTVTLSIFGYDINVTLWGFARGIDGWTPEMIKRPN